MFIQQSPEKKGGAIDPLAPPPGYATVERLSACRPRATAIYARSTTSGKPSQVRGTASARRIMNNIIILKIRALRALFSYLRAPLHECLPKGLIYHDMS